MCGLDLVDALIGRLIGKLLYEPHLAQEFLHLTGLFVFAFALLLLFVFFVRFVVFGVSRAGWAGDGTV